MLGLLNKKPDHPMADIKSAQQLLLDLPKNDALKSVHEVSAWLESAREQEDVRLDRQFEVVRLLDETARYYERKLMREYYTDAELAAFQEKRLWMALNEFSTQVLLAYLKIQVRYRNGDKGASSIKEVMPLIAVRGINAARGMLKSAAARHALFDQAIWVSLAEFYAHAEAEQYVDEPVVLYGTEKTSVRAEFAALLMWYASSFGTFGRLHTHLAERLFAGMGADFTVSAQRDAGSLLGFDLEFPMSPMRVGVKLAPQRSLRFIGMGTAQQRIDALLKSLAKNVLPEGLNLGGSYEIDAVRDAALRVAGRMTSPPPARRNVRHAVKATLGVANGFSEVVEQTGMGLDFGGGSSKTWQVEDISVSGIRCVLPSSEANGVAIGMLVGTKPEKQELWGVGIVRRMNRDLRNSLHIGIEMLSRQVSAVNLRERETGQELHALWLDNPGGDTGEVDLLVSPEIYDGSRSLHAQVEGRNYLLMPLKLVERGGDYDLVRYRKIEEDTSPD